MIISSHPVTWQKTKGNLVLTDETLSFHPAPSPRLRKGVDVAWTDINNVKANKVGSSPKAKLRVTVSTHKDGKKKSDKKTKHYFVFDSRTDMERARGQILVLARLTQEDDSDKYTPATADSTASVCSQHHGGPAGKSIHKSSSEQRQQPSTISSRYDATDVENELDDGELPSEIRLSRSAQYYNDSRTNSMSRSYHHHHQIEQESGAAQSPNNNIVLQTTTDPEHLNISIQLPVPQATTPTGLQETYPEKEYDFVDLEECHNKKAVDDELDDAVENHDRQQKKRCFLNHNYDRRWCSIIVLFCCLLLALFIFLMVYFFALQDRESSLDRARNDFYENADGAYWV